MKVYSLTKITTKINGEKRLTYIEARDLSERWYNQKSKTFVIPEGFTHITEYGLDCFKDEMECLVIPRSIVWIDKRAFADCKSLKEIKVDSENKIFGVTDGALRRKNAFEKYWEPQENRGCKTDSPTTQPFPKPVMSNEEGKSTDKISDKQLDEWLKRTDGQSFLKSLQDDTTASDVKEKPTQNRDDRSHEETSQDDGYEGEVVDENEADNSFWSIMILIVACGICILLSSLS